VFHSFVTALYINWAYEGGRERESNMKMEKFALFSEDVFAITLKPKYVQQLTCNM
jgi:hypothetical protein